MSGKETAIIIPSEPASNHNSSVDLPLSALIDLPESDEIEANSSAVALEDGTREVGTLDWVQAIELEEFNKRKAGIEEKILLLERTPPIEVFGGLDTLLCSSETISAELPTRADLQAWTTELDRIEKDTEYFYAESRKLKKFTKAAAERGISPADTDLIELTFATILAVDKLLRLLRDRSKDLELLALRLKWEEHRCAAWADYHKVMKDLGAFLENLPQLFPPVYENTAGAATDMSRATRPRFSDALFKEAEALSTRISSLRDGDILAAGRTLDKLIDESRKPVPDTILNEQDWLEEKGIGEMEDLGQFVTNVVVQWKKADEIYAENELLQALALQLIEDIVTAFSSRPTSHQSTLFTSRANILSTRLSQRGDPAAVENTLLRPRHTLFPEQDARHRLLVSTLSAEMAQSVELTQKAENLAKKYHDKCEIAEWTGRVHTTAEQRTEQFEAAGQKPDSSRSDILEVSPWELSPFPAIPQAQIGCFPREEILNEILDLTDQVASTALFGLVGVGKSSVALSLLHHIRTKAKFRRNRHFMRCDDLTNSLNDFLDRLSGAIGADRTTDIGQLRSHIDSSPPFILLLDGVDSFLDPLVPEAEDIFATIEEFGCYQHVCLVTTSRMYPDIPGFHRVEVPTLSGEGAGDAFYSLCNLDRSSAVDNLIAGFDFHPLLICLLADSIRENNWDESTLLKAWDDGQAGVLKARYHQSLRAAVEPLFLSPRIQHFGNTARRALEAIAAFPCGVEEGRILPSTAGVGVVVDVLCQFSLVYREGGLVKMFSPLRQYFLDSMLEPAQHVEVIHWDAAVCSAAKGLFPTYTSGPIRGLSKVPPRENWGERFKSMKRKLRAFFDRSRAPSIGIVHDGSPDRPSALTTRWGTPAPVSYRIEP